MTWHFSEPTERTFQKCSKFFLLSFISLLPLDFHWRFTIWIEPLTLPVICNQGNFLYASFFVHQLIQTSEKDFLEICKIWLMYEHSFGLLFGCHLFRNYDPFERLIKPNIRFTALFFFASSHICSFFYCNDFNIFWFYFCHKIHRTLSFSSCQTPFLATYYMVTNDHVFWVKFVCASIFE